MSNNIENAFISSQRAISFDKRGNIQAAIYYYNEAIRYLQIGINSNYDDENDTTEWKNALEKYQERLKTLQEISK